MDICVVSGVGEGQTLLSSFDAALKSAGVYNYNLLYLSSIIPPGSRVIEKDEYQTPENEYGHKLYVVRAVAQSDTVGTTISAGVGWYQLPDGRGVFVEHEIFSSKLTETEAAEKLKETIVASLKDICQFRQFDFDENNVRYKIETQRVGDKPKTLVVIAVYKSEEWK